MDEPLSNLDAKLRVQMRTQVSRIQKALGTTTIYVTHDQTEAMTLGDRVVVMRGGLIQQVGSPQELYDHPVNLFVAGFIGSPSMNFLPGKIKGDTVESPLGEAKLPEGALKAIEASSGGNDVILGIRPEHFEDASIVKDKPGGTFTTSIDLVESMGSDVFAYFTLRAEEAHSKDLEDLAADTGYDLHGDGISVTSRLDAASRVREGQEVTLWYDTSKMQVFDAKSGMNLVAKPTDDDSPEEPPSPAMSTGQRDEGEA
jgi:multiple sugar transport system ATP-binding protein